MEPHWAVENQLHGQAESSSPQTADWSVPMSDVDCGSAGREGRGGRDFLELRIVGGHGVGARLGVHELARDGLIRR